VSRSPSENPCREVSGYEQWASRSIVFTDDLEQIRYYAGRILRADPEHPAAREAAEIAFIVDNILDKK
jgi:hypothetical protein